MVSFLHISDVHLGYQQYGNAERFNDFGKAFLKAVEFAVDKKVDFVIICGDLFHKAAIDPKTLLQSNEGFERLAGENIRAVVVNGNHDKARYSDGISWLHYLSYRGHIILLSPVFSEEGIRLDSWNGEKGSYIDIGGIRIFGIPYLGSAIEPILEEMPIALESLSTEDIKFSILMGHFGLEGEIPGVAGGISQSLLEPIKKHVDYFGLGHLHKPFSKDNWIYNPGALEVLGMDERNRRGGYYYVTLDENYIAEVEFIESPKRPFYRFVFKVDEYQSVEELYKAFREFLDREWVKAEKNELKPVVEVSLEGICNFDATALDMNMIDTIIQDVIDPLLSRPRNSIRSKDFDFGIDQPELSRNELEAQYLLDIIRNDSRFRENAEYWVGVTREIKNLVLADSTPEGIVETILRRMDQDEEN